jgi:hypothetical protein
MPHSYSRTPGVSREVAARLSGQKSQPCGNFLGFSACAGGCRERVLWLDALDPWVAAPRSLGGAVGEDQAAGDVLVAVADRPQEAAGSGVPNMVPRRYPTPKFARAEDCAQAESTLRAPTRRDRPGFLAS